MIKAIRYRRGFAPTRGEVDELPELVLKGDEISADLVRLLDETKLLQYEGTHGDPGAGDPLQYDRLCIDHDEGVTEIIFYNRAIALFVADREVVRHIHQVCCALEDLDRPAV